ncbi:MULTISPECIES: hypothetical protein [Chryseobacterium]|uniref:hypothetical protein n=1 Tax=Chryseobacterium sp. R2A-55 TaxID=2744445 RepID=UPI001F21F9E6|nr:hypothetical protein [Chryseobacterium sp. R2A-55]
MKNLLFLFVFFFFQNGFSQQTEFLKIRQYKVAELSDSIRETSGLHFFKNKLYTFNDSGNTSEIFEIDKNSGKILNVIKTNLQNKDWEAMTSDSGTIYIGDFGNNAGARKDLKIYRINLDSLVGTSNANHDAQVISFYYPEQTDFKPKNINNDFDAEAMVFLNGKIHLFTKEWVSRKTTHYIIDPEVSDQQPARKIENFQIDFAVTDASYFDGKLYLVGYTKKTEVFLSIFTETETGIFFTEKPKKYYLGSSMSIGQIEGIAVNGDGIYISGEEFRTPFGKIKQCFYFVPNDDIRP